MVSRYRASNMGQIVLVPGGLRAPKLFCLTFNYDHAVSISCSNSSFNHFVKA
jgi:hypothetical protein